MVAGVAVAVDAVRIAALLIHVIRKGLCITVGDLLWLLYCTSRAKPCVDTDLPSHHAERSRRFTTIAVAPLSHVTSIGHDDAVNDATPDVTLVETCEFFGVGSPIA